MARADLWSGMFWLVVGTFVAWRGYDLGLGRVSDPGSGFALFWIGLLMVALSASVGIAGLAAGAPTLASLWRGLIWRRALLASALLVAYAAAFEWVGFPLATTLLLLALMLIVERVTPWIAVLIAVTAPIAMWLPITRWLKITIPGGLLAPWLS